MDFIIKEEILVALDDYHEKSLMMQRYHFESNPDQWSADDLTDNVNDLLIRHVPIYDMRDRRYAAFSSLLEAIMRPDDDPKGNSPHFPRLDMDLKNSLVLFYLFRLCGSGINYIPKTGEPFGSHGFGNFWVIDMLREGITDPLEWIKALSARSGPFTDNKGYLLPQFSFKHLGQGHLKYYIQNYALELCDYLYEVVSRGCMIIEGVDFSNEWLKLMGFKRQNFVLSATMADVAEYFPENVDPQSMIYAGTNARKCIKAIFTKMRGVGTTEFESQCIRFLADRYDTTPYSAEDSRLCDVVRYFKEYQSPHHVARNGGNVYKNNSVLKDILGEQEYYMFANNL